MKTKTKKSLAPLAPAAILPPALTPAELAVATGGRNGVNRPKFPGKRPY